MLNIVSLTRTEYGTIQYYTAFGTTPFELVYVLHNISNACFWSYIVSNYCSKTNPFKPFFFSASLVIQVCNLKINKLMNIQ